MEWASFLCENGPFHSGLGTHTNRTVTLKTNYDFLDHEFRQKSHWELAPHVWATYNVVINNKTTREKREQHIELDMAYPRRDFSMKGYYQILNNSLSSEIAIQWDKKNLTKKSIGASIDWKRISLYPNKQHAVLSIKHPSFKRDVTFNANYLSGDKEFVDIASEVVYSTENNKKLRLSGKLLDNSQNLYKQYDYELLGNHPATRLDLKVFGDLHAGNGLYKSNNVAQYKRTYLPLQKGETNAFLNTIIKEIEIESGIEEMYSALWNSILESVDYWKVYLASETNEAIHDVWLDAKPVVQRFLDDIRVNNESTLVPLLDKEGDRENKECSQGKQREHAGPGVRH
uniref:Uncharacterized protein n=1 Tax=Timema shepardi TaxID=629360 RepID=A0A7R9FWX3_TIMSH|nr:unnamed protein product [Timema shepardi]